MSKRIFVLAVFCVALCCYGQKAFAQATGSFSGTVTDKSGAAIAGASVKVTSQTTGISRDTVTDEIGHYIVNLLPVSVYTIRVEFKGFQPLEAKDVRLQVDEQRELNFGMTLTTVTSSVEVSAEAVTVETANPSLGQVITSQEVAQLPLNGRDFVQLATLTPGTTQETNPNSFFTSAASSEVAARGSYSLSVGGSRPNSTDWLLDGVDNNELTAGGISILSSIDDIQEFKVLTYNYSAEYGTRAGPTVLLTTKSGSNSFHGSLFEFLRNTDLDAKSFFATSAEKFNLNQFGGSVGGPLQKNKTFFFLDGEQKYQRHGITFTGLVPSMAMRGGDFTDDAFGNPASITVDGNPVPSIINPNMIGASLNPNVFPNVYFQCDANGNPTALVPNGGGEQVQGTACAKIPQGLTNSIGQAMINLYPQPNANNPTAGYNFVDSPVRSLDETKFDTRLDHTFSSADSLFARFSYDQAVSYVPGGGGVGSFAEANAFGSNQGIANHARNVAIGETHVFSPTKVNQFTFGFSRILSTITSQGTGTCESEKLGIPGANLDCSTSKCVGYYSCGLVSTSFTGNYWALGDRGYAPLSEASNVFSVNDTFDVVHGKHDIKLGVGIRDNQMNTGTQAFQDGFWVIGGATGGNFSGLGTANIPGDAQADLLLGYSGLAIHDQSYDGPAVGRRWKIYRPFIQDDWRVNKDLTLNLGLAWDLTTPISEVDGRIANLIPTTGQLVVANKDGANEWAGIQRQWTAFEPRLGVAWKVLGSEKTVVRAGYAVYHDSAWSMGDQGLWQNPPFFAESDAFATAGCIPGSYCQTVLGQTPGAPITLSQGFQLIPTAPTSVAQFTGAFVAEDPNTKIGKVQQFNVNVEHQLPGQVVLTVGYAGSRGNHILLFGDDLNTSSPSACTGGSYTLGCLSNGQPYFPPFNLPNFNTVYGILDTGKTNYDSLQIKAETKSARYGLYALIGYTYSRTYDNGLSDGLGSVLSAPYFPLPNWQNLDWALSQINLNNAFTASVIYDLPFGRGKKFGSNWNDVTNSLLGNWQVTVIQRIASGFPVPLIDSNNESGVYFQNGNGDNWNRPNQIANPYKAGIVPSNPNPMCSVLVSNGGLAPNSLSNSGYPFNPCAFAGPTPGQLGSANRAPVNGPGFVNTDFSVIKQFTLPWENMGLNFRAEFFNLFNHPQFGMPVNDINAPGFGSVNSTVNNPRLVQFGLKLTF